MPPQFENNISQVNNPETKQARSHKFLITLFVLLLASAAFAWWYLCNLPQDLESETFATQTSEFADWKTYRNEEYGFEFKYPSEFIVYSGFKNEQAIEATPTSTEFWIAQNNGILQNGEPSAVGVKLVSSTDNPTEWLNKNKSNYSHQQEIKYIKNTNFANKQAVELIGGCNLGSVCQMYVLEATTNYLLVVIKNNDIEKLNKILSTFKFTK